MVDIRFETTQIGHIRAICATGLRNADELEVVRATGQTVLDALTEASQQSAINYTVFIDGEPTVLFGAVPAGLLTNDAIIWMVATDRIYQAKDQITPLTAQVLDDFKRRYRCLWNYVDAENEVSIVWLKQLGFDFAEKTTPCGPEGYPFYRFEWRAE